MNIAMVFDGLDFGGIERVGIEYAKIMLSLGHKVDIYNLRPEKAGLRNEFPQKCRVFDHPFPRGLAPELYSYGVKRWWWGRFVYPFMWLILTVVVFFYALFTGRHGKRYDIAIAFSGHVNDLTYVTSGFLHAKKRACWLHGALSTFMMNIPGYVPLLRRVKNVAVLVSDGEELALYLNKFLNLNITRIYNPTTIGETPADMGRVAEITGRCGRFLLMSARFAYPHKDHYTVLNALGELVARGRDINAVFIGDGRDRKAVEGYCRKCGLQDRVFFEGSVVDVRPYYEAAEVLVHSSVAGEGLPMAIIEAMSCGTPVVATDSKTGPREIIGNDEYGLLCGIKDPTDMARQIDRLITDREVYAHYKRQAIARARDFSPEAIKKELAEFLNKLR